MPFNKSKIGKNQYNKKNCKKSISLSVLLRMPQFLYHTRRSPSLKTNKNSLSTVLLPCYLTYLSFPFLHSLYSFISHQQKPSELKSFIYNVEVEVETWLH